MPHERPLVEEIESRYLGETSQRRPAVALALALLGPGSAWTYVGELRRGLLLNALAVALWAGFVAIWAARPFPLAVPLWTFGIGWGLFVVMAGADAGRVASRSGDRYVLRGVNHPILYVAVGVFAFILPLVGLHHAAHTRVWNVIPVTGHAMYPTLIDGDRLMVVPNAYSRNSPRPGEIVLYATDSSERIGRVIAGPGSTVAVTDDIVFVDDTPMRRHRVGGDELARVHALSGQLDLDVLHFVEEIHGAAFHIVAPRRSFVAEPESFTLQDDEFVVLNDNRSDRSDSRRVGVVRRAELRGRPLFVLSNAHARTVDEADGRQTSVADRQGKRVQPASSGPAPS